MSTEVQRVPARCAKRPWCSLSGMAARRSFGDEVVDHHPLYRSECDAYDSAVTD
jgi:hypothetical protein